MLSRHSLTLKEWSKVKSDSPKRFTANGFLKVDSTLQTSRFNNKPTIGTFILSHHNFTLKELSKVKSLPLKDLQHMVS